MLYFFYNFQAGANEEDYICRIVELFESADGSPCFRARWFYRASDTVSSVGTFTIELQIIYDVLGYQFQLFCTSGNQAAF